MTSTGRRGSITVHRSWLANPDLSDSALRLMLWLDSHGHEYLRALNYSRTAEEIGWGRNRVKRTLDELVLLGLVSVAHEARRHGGTVARITLHLEAWSDGPSWTSAMVHGDAPAMVHGDAPTTSKCNIEDSELLGVSHVSDERLAAGRLCEFFADVIEADGAKRPNITETWITDMERLIRLDYRTPEQIQFVIQWLASGRDEIAQFWFPNVRSPRKLREKWDQMAAQYKRRSQTAKTTTNPYRALLEEEQAQEANS